jgi:hypothetical protein
MVDDRDQTPHVIIAIRHDHPPLRITHLSAATGFSNPSAVTEVRPAHDNYIRSTIGRDRTTVPNALAQLMGALGD